MRKKGVFFLPIIASLFCATSLTAFAIPEYYDLKVDIEFCNPTRKHLDLPEVVPGEDIDICISVKNLNEEEKFLRMYFVDGFVDKVSSNYVVCENREDERDEFAKFTRFTKNREENVFSLGGDEVFQISAFANVGRDYIGPLYGCLVTEKVYQDTKDGSININVRKANTITLDVKGDLKLGLSTTLNEEVEGPKDTALTLNTVTRNKDAVLSYLGAVISPYIEASEDFIQGEEIELNSAQEEEKLKREDKTYVWREKVIFESENLEIIQKGNKNNFYIKRKLENIGAVPLDVTVSSNISNNLGTVFTAKQQVTIAPFKSIILNTDIGSFPEYNKGDFRLNNTIEYIPVSENKRLKTPFVKTEELDFFVFPVKMVAYITAFALFVGFLFIFLFKEFIVLRVRAFKKKSIVRGKPRRKVVKKPLKTLSKKKVVKREIVKEPVVKKKVVKKTISKKPAEKKPTIKKASPKKTIK